MQYGGIRKEFYEKILTGMIGQMATLLDDGKSIEIDRSRSGLKLYSFRRRHEVVQKQSEAATDRK